MHGAEIDRNCQNKEEIDCELPTGSRFFPIFMTFHTNKSVYCWENDRTLIANSTLQTVKTLLEQPYEACHWIISAKNSDGNLTITVDASRSYMGTFHVYEGLNREEAKLIQGKEGVFVTQSDKGVVVVFLSNNSDCKQPGSFTY